MSLIPIINLIWQLNEPGLHKFFNKILCRGDFDNYFDGAKSYKTSVEEAKERTRLIENSFATIPKGIKIAAVSTLKEALTALNSATPRSCANLGA